MPIGSSDAIVNALAPFGIGNSCKPATNVQAVANGTNVNLTWDAPKSKTDKSIIYFEGFENAEDFTVPEGWTSIDADGDGEMWLAFAGAEGWMLAYNGSNMAGSFSWNGAPLTPDNYLISPNIEGATRVRYLFSVNDGYPNEHYAIMASTTDTDVNNFTTVFEESTTGESKRGIRATTQKTNSVTKDQTPWVERVIELPQNTKHVAFRHFSCTDQNYLLIDDVAFIKIAETGDYTYTITREGVEIATELTETSYTDNNVPAGTHDYCVKVVYTDCTSAPACATISGINDEVVANSVRIFPNPAKDVINVEGDVRNITMYNSLGQAVKAGINNGQIDVTSLQNGIYYLTTTSSNNTREVEKVIIAK